MAYFWGILLLSYMGIILCLFGCFTIATTVPQDTLDFNTQRSLLHTSIAFGFLHLYFEIRQFTWKPLRYISYIWNWFGNGC